MHHMIILILNDEYIINEIMRLQSLILYFILRGFGRYLTDKKQTH
jgi:hypothetical protein